VPDVIADIPEIFASLVAGVPELILEVRSVEAAGGFLDLGLDIAIEVLGVIHDRLLMAAEEVVRRWRCRPVA
jgi:hypothetical protein